MAIAKPVEQPPMNNPLKSGRHMLKHNSPPRKGIKDYGRTNSQLHRGSGGGLKVLRLVFNDLE